MPHELHPWNRDFRWTDHPGPWRIVDTEQARAFDEQGFFVARDVFDADTLARVIAEIDPIEADVTAFLRTRGEEVTMSNTPAPAAFAELLQQAVTEPVVSH